jgi:3'-phosphoadenosine 5'-phosphosulfate sulfotransferase (PAPS reductase)/FAD synthetase
MTLEEFMEIGYIRANSNQFFQKWQKSKEVVKGQLKKFDKPYICLSAGKDSVAMAFIIAEVADELNCKNNMFLWAHVSDASFPGTIETLNKVSEKTGINLIINESPVSAFSTISKKTANDVKKFGKQGYFFDAIEDCIEKYNRNLAFIGVRAYESRRRMRAVKAHGMAFTSHVPTFCNICYPMAWYKLEDVAAIITLYNAPMHPIYSKMDTSIGYSTKDEHWIRLGYITARDLMEKGTIVFLKRNYPEQYNKLAEAFPEVKGYV